MSGGGGYGLLMEKLAFFTFLVTSLALTTSDWTLVSQDSPLKSKNFEEKITERPEVVNATGSPKSISKMTHTMLTSDYTSGDSPNPGPIWTSPWLSIYATNRTFTGESSGPVPPMTVRYWAWIWQDKWGTQTWTKDGVTVSRYHFERNNADVIPKDNAASGSNPGGG
jgi:hypothetical protein